MLEKLNKSKTNLSIKLKGLGKVELKKCDIPKLSQGEVLLEVIACGLCASDIKVIEGKKPAKPGITLGHEIVGRVVESKNEKVEVGKIYSVYPSVVCGKCYSCKRGYYNLCTNKMSLGYSLDGGFARYVRIPKEIVDIGGLIYIGKIPETLGAIIEPAGCVLNSLKSSEIDRIESMLVVGGGALGLFHIIIGKHFGKTISILEHNEERRRLAETLGASKTYEDIKEIKDNFDLIILACSAYDLVKELIELLNVRGIINVFAGSRYENITIPIGSFHYQERKIIGTHSTTPTLMKEVSAIVEKNIDSFQKVITHQFSIKDFEKALKYYKERKAIKVLITPD